MGVIPLKLGAPLPERLCRPARDHHCLFRLPSISPQAETQHHLVAGSGAGFDSMGPRAEQAPRVYDAICPLPIFAESRDCHPEGDVGAPSFRPGALIGTWYPQPRRRGADVPTESGVPSL